MVASMSPPMFPISMRPDTNTFSCSEYDYRSQSRALPVGSWHPPYMYLQGNPTPSSSNAYSSNRMELNKAAHHIYVKRFIMLRSAAIHSLKQIDASPESIQDFPSAVGTQSNRRTSCMRSYCLPGGSSHVGYIPPLVPHTILRPDQISERSETRPVIQTTPIITANISDGPHERLQSAVPSAEPVIATSTSTSPRRPPLPRNSPFSPNKLTTGIIDHDSAQLSSTVTTRHLLLSILNMPALSLPNGPEDRRGVTQRCVKSMPILPLIWSSKGDREGEGGDEEYKEDEIEDEEVVGPFPPSQSTAISDTTSPTPVGGYIPPVSNSSTAIGPGIFTDKPGDLLQSMMTMDLARSSPRVYEQGSAFHAEENPPISGAGTSRGPQGPVPQVDAPRPKPHVVPQVAVPSNGGASDRSRAPSIRALYEDSSADPITPGMDLSHPDEPHLSNPPIPALTQPADVVPHNEDDGGIPVMVPIPHNVGQPMEAALAQSIHGFDTGETHPPPPHLPENVVYRQPPAHPDCVPSEGISMDCGMLPSYLHPPGQRASRRRILSPQESEQGMARGDDRARAGWVVPFSVDSRPNNSHQQDSGERLDGTSNDTRRFETHSVSPHISAPGSSSGYDLHSHSPANPRYTIPPSTKPPPPQDDRPFNAHGWVEHLLPDESLYYVHQGYQVVADVDLSDEKLLVAVMAYLEDHGDVIPPGQEFWLQDMRSREGGFVSLRWLVDHTKQLVAFDSSHEVNGDSRDDRLDAKYRYWSFMEAHPAHISLPPDAYQDAMDALNWASTDGLIQSHPSRSTPAPFTQEECQSLNALLQSIGKRGETPLRTHTVSKILLRVVCWRQSYFRPDKPLPTDAERSGLRREHCSMPVRGSVFMLIVGVYACLVAVVVLCPVHNFVRIVGIGAILIPLFPAVSNVVEVVRSKVDNCSIVHSCFRQKTTVLQTQDSPPRPPGTF